MPASYSQLRAAFALAKASLIATLRSPTSVVFSLLFPVIFIVVFGSMVDPTVQLKIAIAPGSDTDNVIYRTITAISNITIDKAIPALQVTDALQKRRLTAMISIKKEMIRTQPHFFIEVTSATASKRNSALLKTLLTEAVSNINDKAFPGNVSLASIEAKEMPGRVYRQIDFILPGQLGFSLLMAGVFGSSFLLFSLRKSVVLKRLAATPVQRSYLILGEMISRLFFHVISFIIMIALGYFIFSFTLINGIITVLEMLAFSLLGLIIFMAIGFIISGVVENESSIAPAANTLTLPQVLLCGLFFPVDNYPHWLQSFCNILPLTFLVDGLRKIAFEGLHIWEMPVQVGGLCVWALLVSILCVKVFKWE
jgi:ABC-2 type transport system permease protein